MRDSNISRHFFFPEINATMTTYFCVNMCSKNILSCERVEENNQFVRTLLTDRLLVILSQ